MSAPVVGGRMQTASDHIPKTYSTRYGKFEIQTILQRNGFTTFLSSTQPISVIGVRNGYWYLFCVCSHGKFVPDLVSVIRSTTELQSQRIVICTREKSGFTFRELLAGGLVPFGVNVHGCN